MVSVVVPCCNLELWIRDCLDSVLSQSFADWECIVIDDESRDGSPAILDEYAAKDSRIKVIHQKNAGEGGARNAGLAVAKGEWVFFLDGDDVMAPGALERLVKIIDRHPNEDLIRFGFKNFEDGAVLPKGDSSFHLGEYVDISREIKYDDYCVYVWQFMFRRKIIADMKFDRYKRGADRTFIVPVLCSKVKSFIATDNVCYFYRRRQGSAVNSRASVQVLKDELSHRVDVIEAIDNSGKDMPYEGTAWLERYCLFIYLEIAEASGGYTDSERRELVDWFYYELRRFRKAKDYSIKGKVIANAYWLLRFSSMRNWVRMSFPVWLHRLNLMIRHPMLFLQKLCTKRLCLGKNED